MNTPILTLGQLILISLFFADFSNAADTSKQIKPRPNDLVSKESLKQFTGDWEGVKISRDIRILWLTGPEDHGGGSYDYIRVKELFVQMLRSIPCITVEEAFQFPTRKQFDQADLLIQYLHFSDLTDDQFALYQQFVDRGGRVVSIHESCIVRPIERARKLASCIGCSWKGHKTSKWTKFAHEHRLHLDTKHPAFSGLPASLQLNDESYWNLLAREEIEVIGALAPEEEKKQTFDSILELPNVRSHAFWTYTPGKAKVFGTIMDHLSMTSDIWTRIRQYNMRMLSKLVRALEETPEGNGTMMDNTLIVYTSNNADKQHTNGASWPFMTLGDFGGAMHEGHYVKIENDRPINSFYATLLEAAGNPVEHFNLGGAYKKYHTGNGPLRELLA